MGAYRGFIFASLSPTGITLDEHLGRAKGRIDRFIDLSPEGEVEVRAGVHKYRYRANWKMALENTMDGYHGAALHESFFGMVKQKGGMDLDAVMRDPNQLMRDLGNGHVVLDTKYASSGASATMARTPLMDAQASGAQARPEEKAGARLPHSTPARRY